MKIDWLNYKKFQLRAYCFFFFGIIKTIDNLFSVNITKNQKH